MLSNKQYYEDINNSFRSGGKTSVEWAKTWGVGHKKALRVLRKLNTDNKLISYPKTIKDITGRVNYTYVYEIIE